MPTELQEIVDSVGKQLRRAVLIEDARFRHHAHSSHYGTVDSVRTASILHRIAPREATDWALTFGIAQADGPIRLPPNPDLQMDARVCVSIKHQGLLLGYLWLIDTQRSLTDHQLSLAQSAADTAGTVMYRERLLSELARGRERELLRDLLSNEAAVRRHAFDELIERELFAPQAPVAALVVRAVSRGGTSLAPSSPAEDAVRVALTGAIDHLRRRSSPRRMLGLMRPDHALVVTALGDPAWAGEGLAGMAEDLRASATDSMDGAGRRVVVGIGDPRPNLAELADSYREAMQAARIGEIVSTFGSVVAWSDLGIYQLLGRLPLERLSSDALHPGLVRLAEHRDGARLLETLERYLDSGCNVRTTARDMLVHRASMYERLRRIERVAGVDLRDGEGRLALHLSLKLARLAALSLPNSEATSGP